MTTELRTIDCNYVMPELACAYLRIEGNEAAFIETNTAHSVPFLLEALTHSGKRTDDVRWIIITHVHLDHAGGASALVKACPNAVVLAHPRAAKHLIDPSKLVASAEQVYGRQKFAELYGTIEPIEASRVRAMEDGEEVMLGEAPLRFMHTRGHANHHFVVHDPVRDTVYTGDAFGLIYPRLQRQGRFAFPSTSPTDFDAAAAREAVDRIAALGSRSVCPTHFGEAEEVNEIAEQLRDWIDLSAKLMSECADSPDDALETMLRRRLDDAMRDALAARAIEFESQREFLSLDLDLNAQGLAHVVRKARAPRSR